MSTAAQKAPEMGLFSVLSVDTIVTVLAALCRIKSAVSRAFYRTFDMF